MVDRIQHRIDQEVFQGISSSLPHIHKTQPTLSNELHKQLLQHQCLADKVASIPTRTYSGCYIVDESRRLLGTLFFFLQVALSLIVKRRREDIPNTAHCIVDVSCRLPCHPHAVHSSDTIADRQQLVVGGAAVLDNLDNHWVIPTCRRVSALQAEENGAVEEGLRRTCEIIPSIEA